MAWIALEGMQFRAFHGVHDAERIVGNDFEIDVHIKTGISKAAASDNVENALNYETVYLLCKLEMAKPRKLLESVLYAIADGLKHQFSDMQGLRIRVRKLQPPLGGRVDAAWVEEEMDFVSECGRCKKKMISYSDDDCWTKGVLVHPATRETLERQFGKKCFCQDCLKLYAG